MKKILCTSNLPKHIAFIMDGNRRWAKSQHLSINEGHDAGLKTMKEIIEACLELKIPVISFYAFSMENHQRMPAEVNHLMKILLTQIVSKKILKWFIDNNVRLIWNGSKQGLSSNLVEKIHAFMDHTKHGSNMTIQIMFNYGSQQMIADAAQKLADQQMPINVESMKITLNPMNLPFPDLLIRTSGELRLSNFMLYELAYSEFIFNPIYWPDYHKDKFLKDLQEYQKRTRRFGG